MLEAEEPSHSDRTSRHLPPLFTELADLVHHHAVLGGVEGGGGHPELRPPGSERCHLQDAVGEGEHHPEVHQGVGVLTLSRDIEKQRKFKST